MTRKKLSVVILFGGNSGEYEVSLMSAASVIRNIDKEKYNIIHIGITKEGQWMYYHGDVDQIQSDDWVKTAKPIVFPPDPSYGGFVKFDDPENVIKVDVVFPVIHGPNCEDGSVQGVLELAGIAYVGCGVASSGAAMDKIMAKDLFGKAGIPQNHYIGLLRDDIINDKEQVIQRVEESLGYPCFIKPANMGSSVGISKAHDRYELEEALGIAGEYDRRIIAEQFIDSREIECAVLGNNNPETSVVGEIISCNEFYDYNAKYFDNKSELIIPADIPDNKANEIMEYAKKAYKALDCSGLARVDFFLEKSTMDVLINEINTIPGFTKISMYPKLWDYSGLNYTKLIDTLIQLALERKEENK